MCADRSLLYSRHVVFSLLSSLLGMFTAIFILLLSGVIGPDYPRVGSMELDPRVPHSEVWTAGELRRIASDSTISKAFDAMVEAADGRRWIPLRVYGRMYAVDSMAPHDIRHALLSQAGWKASVRRDLLSFVTSDDAALTCSTPRSAGATGLWGCMARCERRPFEFLGGRKPIAEGCYILCSLAVAPCHDRPFTWPAWFKAGERGMHELVLRSFHRLLDVAVAMSTVVRSLNGMTAKEAIVYLVTTYVVTSILEGFLLVVILILVIMLVLDHQKQSYRNRLPAVPENLEQHRELGQEFRAARAHRIRLPAVPDDLEQRRELGEEFPAVRAHRIRLPAVPDDLEQLRELGQEFPAAWALRYLRRHGIGGLDRFEQANENVSEEDDSDDETEIECFKWEGFAECESESEDDDNSLHSH